MGEASTWDQFPNAPARGAALCPAEQVADGQALMLALGESEKPFRLILARSGERLFAYVNACAHFGVPLAARQEQLRFGPHEYLMCNVHYARFRWQDGYCYRGDCEGDSLVPVPVVERDGLVHIA